MWGGCDLSWSLSALPLQTENLYFTVEKKDTKCSLETEFRFSLNRYSIHTVTVTCSKVTTSLILSSVTKVTRKKKFYSSTPRKQPSKRKYVLSQLELLLRGELNQGRRRREREGQPEI